MDHRTLNDLAEELRSVLGELELEAEVEVLDTIDGRLGELRVDVDGRSLRTVVATRADLRPVHARDLPALGPDRSGLVFADRVGGTSRQELAERGWGWFDRRRGRIRLWAPGLRLDTDVAPRLGVAAPTSPGNPFTPAGIEVAVWLLAHPDDSASPRALARALDISPSQVSNLLKALTAHALLRRDRRPLVPELFWALAEHWRPVRHPVASLPTPSELAESPELRADSWVVTDTVAAARLGAGFVVSPDYPPDLYLPDERSLSWLLGRTVRASDDASRAATVAVAPAGLACDPRLRLTGEPWPAAHPVVVALDLAVDAGRGREVLDAWDPSPLGVARVW